MCGMRSKQNSTALMMAPPLTKSRAPSSVAFGASEGVALQESYDTLDLEHVTRLIVNICWMTRSRLSNRPCCSERSAIASATLGTIRPPAQRHTLDAPIYRRDNPPSRIVIYGYESRLRRKSSAAFPTRWRLPRPPTKALNALQEGEKPIGAAVLTLDRGLSELRRAYTDLDLAI